MFAGLSFYGFTFFALFGHKNTPKRIMSALGCFSFVLFLSKFIDFTIFDYRD